MLGDRAVGSGRSVAGCSIGPDVRPSEIAVAGLAALSDGSMLSATGQTITTALVGLLIGSAIGISLGAWFGLSAGGRPSVADLGGGVPSCAFGCPDPNRHAGVWLRLRHGDIHRRVRLHVARLDHHSGGRTRGPGRTYGSCARSRTRGWASRLFNIVLPDAVPEPVHGNAACRRHILSSLP